MKIGETFTYNEKTYIAEPVNMGYGDLCIGCAFNVDGGTVRTRCTVPDEKVPYCMPDHDDGDNVIFKEVTQ